MCIDFPRAVEDDKTSLPSFVEGKSHGMLHGLQP